MFLGAEVDDGNCANSRVAAVRNCEGGVTRKFFGKDRGGNFVEAGTAVGFGNRAAEQADFAGLFQHLSEEAFFVELQLGDIGDNFLGNEFLGGLADQALVVGEISGSEHILGGSGGDEKCAAAVESLGNRCGRHVVPR